MPNKPGFRPWWPTDDRELRAEVAAWGADDGCVRAAAQLHRTVNACKIRAVKLGIRTPDGTEHYKRWSTTDKPGTEAVTETDLVAEIVGSIAMPEPDPDADELRRLKSIEYALVTFVESLPECTLRKQLTIILSGLVPTGTHSEEPVAVAVEDEDGEYVNEDETISALTKLIEGVVVFPA